MADGEKEGRTEIQKYEYLENKTSFLNEIKSNFQFLKGYHLVTIIKIADPSLYLQSPLKK